MKNIYFLLILLKVILYLMNKIYFEKNIVCEFYKLFFIIFLRELIMMEYKGEILGNMLYCLD